MPKLSFTPESLRRGFAVAKLVRPMSGDYVLRVVDAELWVCSSDRRRQVHAVVASRSTDAPGPYTSDDFYLPLDRSALFDTDLTQVTISASDKGLVIKAEGDGQTRQATVKKRAESARRSPMPARPSVSGTSVRAKDFEELLHQLTCSALVKDTKTDEDRKVNQVHFYPAEHCASSNARSYASVAYLDGLSLELSVVSDDVPAMRTFCSKSVGDEVVVGQDRTRLFLSDPASGSVAAFSRVACGRPALQVLSEDGYELEMEVDRAQVAKALQWANMAREGTRRLTFRAEDGVLSLSSNGNELSNLPVVFRKGDSLAADFPADILASVVGYVGSEKAVLRFRHRAAPSILEVCEAEAASSVRARHFVQAMKERS